MEIRVSEIMETDVYYLSPDASIKEAMLHMAEKGVSGLPILDAERNLVGYVTAGDMMNYIFKLGKRYDPLFAEDMSELQEDDMSGISEMKKELAETSVMEVATRKMACIYEDDMYSDACRVLGKRKFKKVPVLNNQQQVVGVLNRSKMLRYLFDYQLHRKGHL